MSTITQTITAMPDAPDPASDTPSEFSTKAAATVLAQKNMVAELNTMTGQINTVAGEIAANSATTTAQATIATAGALTVTNALNATRWVSGTNYAQDQCVWSPLDYCIYQRKVAGAGATDPANDPVNWASRSNLKMILSMVSVTGFTRNTDGTIASMTYVTGNKEVFTYVNGAVTTCKYYGTDGVTLLRTQTITYTNGVMSAAPWS